MSLLTAQAFRYGRLGTASMHFTFIHSLYIAVILGTVLLYNVAVQMWVIKNLCFVHFLDLINLLLFLFRVLLP